MYHRIALLTVGIALALCIGNLVPGEIRGHARALADDAVNQKVLKLAAAIKAGKKGEVKKLVADLAKHDLDEVMDAYKLRSRGGLGVGRNAKRITPDGIEAKLLDMEKAAAAPIPENQADALDEMAYVIVAVAEVAAFRGPPAAKKNLKKQWDEAAKQSKDLGISLAEALKKGGQPAKDIAARINANCTNCHRSFKSIN